MIMTQLSLMKINFNDKVEALILLSSLHINWSAIVTTVSSSSSLKMFFFLFENVEASENLRFDS